MKYKDRAKLCYIDTDSFVIHIMKISLMMLKDGLIHLTIIGKNKKVIGLFKDELGGKIMEEFCALRAKTYEYLTNGYNDDYYDKEKMLNKKAKGTKTCVIKRKLTFGNYTDSLFNDKIKLRSQQRFKSDHHEVYTDEVNKISLRSNDNKRLQIFERVTTYAHGTNAFKVCECEMVMVKEMFF